MIIDSKGMKQIEEASGLDVYNLMLRAGTACARQIEKDTEEDSAVLIIAGNGNNGGDGYVIASELNRTCRLYAPLGLPKTDAAKKARKLVKKSVFVTAKNFEKALEKADTVVDCVFGFSYHGLLSEDLRTLFVKIAKAGKKVISVDINSGCEADTGHCDKDALHSHITYALDCYKPFHMLKREHGMFRECRLIPLGLPHEDVQGFAEMDEQTFFAGFPKKQVNAFKGSEGKILLAGGGMGMAGALCLNITGAKTMGASYINAALPEEIYPIAASKHTTAVFHPLNYGNMYDVMTPLIKSAKAIAFGSGAVRFPRSRDCMDLILQTSTVPVILDAEGLRLMVHNTYLFRFIRCPVILTPHIGEFAALVNMETHEAADARIALARKFALENRVYLVLKGADTVAVSPTGEMYINQTGNPALAQAGSGDLLTGIMTACLAVQPDIFRAVCMAVYMHGHIADLGLEEMSVRGFDLEQYPKIMDRLFRQYGL